METSIGDGLLLSVLGIAIVFLGLIFLMVVIFVLSKVAGSKKKPAVAAAGAAPVAAPAPVPAAAPQVVEEAAPVFEAPIDDGRSVGKLDMEGVHDRTGAMLMAIVADELKAPLSALNFKSIKCIGEEKKGDK